MTQFCLNHLLEHGYRERIQNPAQSLPHLVQLTAHSRFEAATFWGSRKEVQPCDKVAVLLKVSLSWPSAVLFCSLSTPWPSTTSSKAQTGALTSADVPLPVIARCWWWSGPAGRTLLNDPCLKKRRLHHFVFLVDETWLLMGTSRWFVHTMKKHWALSSPL